MTTTQRMDSYYPCGCSASGGLLPLPASCPVHGDRDRVRAAAPELLAALKIAAELLERNGIRRQEIDAAIAKAEDY